MRKLLSVAAAFVAAVLLTTNASGVVLAQSSSAGLGITPRKDIVVEAGKTVTDRLQIINLDKTKELKATLDVVDFGAQDETGTPSLRLEENAEPTPWSLEPFLTAPVSATVAPGESKYIDFTIKVPAGQGAGSYYSAIRYVAEGTGGGQVAVGASGATLVFVTVPGKTKESLLLQKFGAYISEGSEGKYQSLFVKTTPKEIAYTLKNQGNVAERPAGSIIIKNMFGKKSHLIEDSNPKASLALIDQTRLFQTCINQPARDADKQDCKSASFMPGRYTIEMSAFYGINGNQTQEIVAKGSFWYLPPWFLVTLFVALAAVGGGGYLAYRRITGGRSFKRR
jgi:hypothetical protein